MTRQELFEIIRPMIVTATGVPECILADPNAPSPDGEYAVIELLPITQVGQGGQKYDEIDAVDGNPDFKDLEVTIRQSQEIQVSVNFYRGAARDYAPRLMQAANIPSINESLIRHRLGWMRTGPVNNLTALNQGNYEPRAQIDIFIRRMDEIKSTVQQIYSAAYEAENENGDTIASGSIGDNDNV